MLDSAAYDTAGFSHMTYYIIIVLANTNRGPRWAAAFTGVVQAISYDNYTTTLLDCYVSKCKCMFLAHHET